ncbi:MAG: SEC-C domain-containing protein [Magnetococcales bacterium]|nr:SEC-C domain-containing protein [Magnetococcales bacterium]
MGLGQDRNQPCSCGSGKKFKRCCIDRKSVSNTVTGDFGEPTTINGCRFGPDGQVEFLMDGKVLVPKRSYQGSHRESNKGEKHLLRVPINPESMNLDESKILRSFSRVFAIDTNTKTKLLHHTVSIACIVECQFITEQPDQYGCVVLGTFEFHDGPVEQQENFAWHFLIRMIQNSLDFSPEQRIAIVTDSDLGKHDEYNERKKPYFKDFFLPIGFSLLYANENGRSMCNQAIRYCDRQAGKMLQLSLDSKLQYAQWIDIHGGWCTRFHGWHNPVSRENANIFRLGSLPSDALGPGFSMSA